MNETDGTRHIFLEINFTFAMLRWYFSGRLMSGWISGPSISHWWDAQRSFPPPVSAQNEPCHRWSILEVSHNYGDLRKKSMFSLVWSSALTGGGGSCNEVLHNSMPLSWLGECLFCGCLWFGKNSLLYIFFKQKRWSYSSFQGIKLNVEDWM